VGSYTSDGQYIASKLEVVQQEKNRVRKRANLSENAMRRIRKIIDNPYNESDTDIVEAVIDALEDWEENMERLEKCGAEMDGFRCQLMVGHKHRHVGADGHNKRRDWPNETPAPASVGEAS
jgi:hypothetical protein